MPHRQRQRKHICTTVGFNPDKQIKGKATNALTYFWANIGDQKYFSQLFFLLYWPYQQMQDWVEIF
jgi:hypothetical protein